MLTTDLVSGINQKPIKKKSGWWNRTGSSVAPAWMWRKQNKAICIFLEYLKCVFWLKTRCVFILAFRCFAQSFQTWTKSLKKVNFAFLGCLIVIWCFLSSHSLNLAFITCSFFPVLVWILGVSLSLSLARSSQCVNLPENALAVMRAEGRGNPPGFH